MTAYDEFAAYVGEINDLLCTINTLTWDARTQMPPGGAETRGQQLATLSKLAQDRFTGEQMGRLLKAGEIIVGLGCDPGFLGRGLAYCDLTDQRCRDAPRHGPGILDRSQGQQ